MKLPAVFLTIILCLVVFGEAEANFPSKAASDTATPQAPGVIGLRQQCPSTPLVACVQSPKTVGSASVRSRNWNRCAFASRTRW
jgi:hypothetical protein